MKKHNFTVLGIIDRETQEELWDNNVSGSAVKKILDPKQRLYEYQLRVGERIKDTAWTEVEKTKSKLESGNYFEEPILKYFAEKSGFGDRVVFDKRTFISEDYKRMHANIDAFIITEEGYQKWLNKEISDDDRIYYIERILECKNTEQEREDLVLSYTQQCLFYSWFLNAQESPLLVYLYKGYSLGWIEINWDKDLYEEVVLSKLIEFIDNLENKIEPEIDIKEVEKIQEFDIDVENPLYDLVQQFKELKEINTVNKKQETDLNYQIKNQISGELIFEGIDSMNLYFGDLILNYTLRPLGGKIDWNQKLDELRMVYLNGLNKAKEEGIDLKKYIDFDFSEPIKTGVKQTQFLTFKKKPKEGKE